MKFVAFDGKIFNTMEECAHYEERSIRFYDSWGNQIFPITIDDTAPIDYIYCGSVDALRAYDEQMGTGFHHSIDSNGWWYWNDDNGEWMDFVEELDCLKHRVNTMEEVFKKMHMN